MKDYLLYDIVWDADEPAELPDSVVLRSDKSMDELLDGAAADWLSDEYGFLVESLSVKEEK